MKNDNVDAMHRYLNLFIEIKRLLLKFNKSILKLETTKYVIDNWHIYEENQHYYQHYYN